MAAERRATRGPHLAVVEGAQVRDEIDHGLHGDKVNFPDPAAAPLGTDAEAGGGRAGPSREPDRMEAVERPNDTNDASNLPIFLFAGIILLIAAIVMTIVA